MHRRVHTRHADAQTNIRLKAAATVEVVEQVGHRRVGVSVAAEIDRRRGLNLIETMTELAFEAEAVRERVAEANVLRPIILEIAVAPAIAAGVSVSAAIDGIARVNAAVPTFRRVCDAGRAGHQRRECERPLQF